MRLEWLYGGAAGFAGGCITQWLSLYLQDQAQKKLLRKSLYREFAAIYAGLQNLLGHLQNTVGKEENPANMPEFFRAECFGAAKSSPAFWRLKDALEIVQMHEHLHFFALSRAKDCQSAAITVRQALDLFRSGKFLSVSELRAALADPQHKATLDEKSR